MPDFDPYEILRLGRGATAAQIKAAYRSRARETHPDLAGADHAEAFQAVVKAFGVLTNPEAKKLFDETGAVDQVNPELDRKKAMASLADVFAQVLKAATEHKMPFASFDFMAAMTALVTDKGGECQISIATMQRQIDDRLRLRKRIRRVRDGGENLFAAVLTKEIVALQKELTSARELARVVEIARTELSSYSSEVDLINAFEFSMHGYSPRQGVWSDLTSTT